MENKKEEDAVMLKDRNGKQMKVELDLDELASVTGGTGSNEGNAGSDGTVTAALGNGMYSVDVGGQTVTAHISGKLRMNYVRIQPGDRVQVDGNRITYRYK